MEYLYRQINISKKGELFWQVFAKRLVSHYLDAVVQPEDDLQIPLCFPVCYIPLFKTQYYWIRGTYNRVWKKYMSAATNFPFLKIFPNMIHGRFAIDGGSVDNIPVYPLLKSEKPVGDEDLDFVFALHFDSRYDYRKIVQPEIPVLDLDLSYCNDFKKAHYDFSEEVINERIEKAYAYGDRLGREIFNSECTPQDLQDAADRIFLEEHTPRQKNYSIDRLVTFLNTIGRRLRSDRKCVKKLFY